MAAQKSQDNTSSLIAVIVIRFGLFFYSRCHLNPPHDLEPGISWAKRPSANANVAILIKLVFQASVYFIWKEKNA